MNQGLVKGAILCFRNPYFYFRHEESTSTASQLSSPASQKRKDLNKVSLLLKDLVTTSVVCYVGCAPRYISCISQMDKIIVFANQGPWLESSQV